MALFASSLVATVNVLFPALKAILASTRSSAARALSSFAALRQLLDRP
jgi:hypothetical protein